MSVISDLKTLVTLERQAALHNADAHDTSTLIITPSLVNSYFQKFFNTHLYYPFNGIARTHLSPFKRGGVIPLPGRGILGKNRSARIILHTIVIVLSSMTVTTFFIFTSILCKKGCTAPKQGLEHM